MKGKAFPLDVFIAVPKVQEFDIASMSEQQLLDVSNSKLPLYAAPARHRPIIGAESALAEVTVSLRVNLYHLHADTPKPDTAL